MRVSKRIDADCIERFRSGKKFFPDLKLDPASGAGFD